MKKTFKFLVFLSVIFLLVGCGCTKKDDPKEPKPGEEDNEKYHFEYEEVMFDNPSDWPTDTFFYTVPAPSAKVDDLVSVTFEDQSTYIITIKEMPYADFKSYTDKLIAAGFSCSRAGYWLPDKEEDLSNNYSQCTAGLNEVYLKATWSKGTISKFNFQIVLTNYDQDTK